MDASKSSSVITISCHLLLRVVEFCRRRGHDADTLCGHAGLSASVLADKQTRIPLALVQEVGTRALELTGDEHFGLHLAQDVGDARHYNIGILALMASATLREAFERFDRSKRYWGDGERIRFEWFAGGLLVRSLMPGPPSAFLRHSHESALAEVALGARAWCGRPVRPKLVRFAHPAPEDLSEHQRVFECPIEFSAPFNELIFDELALRAPMLHANEAFLAIFEQQLEDTLARLPSVARTSDIVRSVARAALCRGDASLAKTASALAMSERTLQRRLQQEGTSHAEILDSARHEMAVAYLTRGLALAEVSERLGYSDTTAFGHAFRRWTGRSPTNFLSHR